MRILHIHSGNLYGGVESVHRTMARCCFAMPRVEMEFALCFEGRIAQELRSAGVKVHMLGAVHARNVFSVIRARRRLEEICKGGAFDATVVHSTWALATLAPSASRPLVLYQHDALFGNEWTDRWARLTHPDLLLANSGYTATSTGNLYPGRPVTVVYPPVELSGYRVTAAERREMRERFGAAGRETVILQAARFEGWKGHRLLLDALADLARDQSWCLWIAGEPQRAAEMDLRLELEERAYALGIRDRVAFLGHMDDVPRLMQSADIYCQPNTGAEPFGLTFVEALHAELPVVTTALGGAREILEPNWGLLTAPEPKALAAGLCRLLLRGDLRDRLGEAGALRAKMLCDPRRQMQLFVDSIRSLREDRAAA